MTPSPSCTKDALRLNKLIPCSLEQCSRPMSYCKDPGVSAAQWGLMIRSVQAAVQQVAQYGGSSWLGACIIGSNAAEHISSEQPRRMGRVSSVRRYSALVCIQGGEPFCSSCCCAKSTSSDSIRSSTSGCRQAGASAFGAESLLRVTKWRMLARNRAVHVAKCATAPLQSHGCELWLRQPEQAPDRGLTIIKLAVLLVWRGLGARAHATMTACWGACPGPRARARAGRSARPTKQKCNSLDPKLCAPVQHGMVSRTSALGGLKTSRNWSTVQ